MELAGISALVVAVGSAVTAVLAYRRNRKADDALNLSKQTDSLLGGMQSFINDLREEAERNRKGWDECMTRCARLQRQLDRQTEETTELHEVVDVLRHKLQRHGLA